MGEVAHGQATSGPRATSPRQLGVCFMRIWLVPIAAMFAVLPVRADEKPIAVPYKLLDTKHVMVRVKMNGKGPFNLIMDTGAPALFFATEAAKKAGLEADK